jgi:hypothetical protein
MPSPFHGMNPYLEQALVWHDFHTRFITAAAEAIGVQVAPAYFVRIEEHLYLHERPLPLARGDVAVVEGRGRRTGDPGSTMVLPATAEVILPAPQVDQERVRYLEVISRDDRRVVTVIELLSWTNKYSGPDRDQFVARRTALVMRDLNYVEIDLLRGGPRMPIGRLPECDYYALVSRPERQPRADFWGVRLRDPLPPVPIPLRSPDPDAVLDLQAVLHRVYDAGQYEFSIYDGQPEPALPPEDAAWAAQFIPARP